ncbi:hypothetical protein CALCODRAFT_506431 [Calocera cornea HHB12733]|uniref:Uncharacterized protein n=1 Tax=Calocera cornea HHB12733 TaxID=1353952 RepID=A0A165J0Y5_9BASI|nr:hypothetical protein CALCODRAFT_506431 [Calocera cornea HHB12733]
MHGGSCGMRGSVIVGDDGDDDDDGQAGVWERTTAKGEIVHLQLARLAGLRVVDITLEQKTVPRAFASRRAHGAHAQEFVWPALPPHPPPSIQGFCAIGIREFRVLREGWVVVARREALIAYPSISPNPAASLFTKCDHGFWPWRRAFRKAARRFLLASSPTNPEVGKRNARDWEQGESGGGDGKRVMGCR